MCCGEEKVQEILGIIHPMRKQEKKGHEVVWETVHQVL